MDEGGREKEGGKNIVGLDSDRVWGRVRVSRLFPG